mgnify:CR=1 FL=1
MSLTNDPRLTLAALFLALALPSVGLAHSKYSVGFIGVGVGTDYHQDSHLSHGGLFLTSRVAELGLLGYGLVGDFGYQPAHEAMYGRLGGEVFAAIFGLRLDAVWEAESDFGVGYSLEVMAPSSYPVFFTVGGQSFFDGSSKFVAGVSILFSVDGQPLYW